MPKPTISIWLNQACSQLKCCDFINNARLEAELLLCLVLKCDRLQLQLRLDDELSDNQLRALNQVLTQRLTNYPLAYITGKKEFYSRQFHVNPSVLIPRPESEVMIEQALAIVNNIFIVQDDKKLPNSPNPTLKPIKILDIGCGSGALGLTLASELAERGIDYQLTLADISESALAVARKNSGKLQIKADFSVSDLLSSITDPSFDIILANLPYVDRQWSFIQNVEFEPELALYAEAQGLELIFKLIDQLASLNKKLTHSWLLLESDPLQQPAVSQYLTDHGFTSIKHIDYITSAKLPHN